MLSGADRSKFDITDGTLTFMNGFTPNYEMPADADMDNTYEVTVVATVGGMSGTRDVKVMVTNMEEAGTVTLNRTQPRAGVSVTATLTDPDGSISGLTWQWYRGNNIMADALPQTECTDDAGDNCVIGGAMADSYTPTDGDVDGDVVEFLTAVAMYTDGEAGMKSAVGQAANPTALDTRNRAPMFEDQDSEADGDQSESTTIMVEENKEADTSDDAATDEVTDNVTDNVGSPINANDPDPNADPLIYTLSGDDAGAFRVRQDDTDTENVDYGGQIEVAAGTELDYETKTTYRVTLTAEDSFGASDTIMVTIMVTDVDEAPEIMLGGLAISGMSSVYYAENGMGAVGMYMATGPDADMASWSLSGEDMSAFSLSNDGVLTFRSSPDYENPADMGMDNMYMVTITADDGTSLDTHDVMVMVTNVDEAGTLTLSTMRPAVGEEITATLTDIDIVVGSSVTWQWARSMDMNSWMDITTGGTNRTYTPTMDDDGMYLRVTAMYTDGEGSGKTEMAMTDNMVIMASTNTAPMFPDTEDGARMVAENTAAGEPVGDPVTAMDTDAGDTLTYALSGADMASFTIDGTMGQITVGAATMLDYETRTTYMVTVTATDAGGEMDMVAVTVTVTNVDEDGTVTLSSMQPVVDTMLTATLDDLDGDITGTTWQWASSATSDGTFAPITGATLASYTPVEAERWHVPTGDGQLHRRRGSRQDRDGGIGQHGKYGKHRPHVRHRDRREDGRGEHRSRGERGRAGRGHGRRRRHPDLRPERHGRGLVRHRQHGSDQGQHGDDAGLRDEDHLHGHRHGHRRRRRRRYHRCDHHCDRRDVG